MALDSRLLEEFYDSRMGQVARRLISQRLRQAWPDLKGQRLLGFGYAVPYLNLPGETADSLGLKGDETYEIIGLPKMLAGKFADGRKLKVRASAAGKPIEFEALVRIDTPQEILYYEHGGILQYVLRQLLAAK